MRDESRIVHTLWIGGRLSLLERLTVTLLQRQGHEVHLWSYGPIENVPDGTILRSAAEILPERSIFRFTGKSLPGIPNGGIGSLSHWSDQFQCKLLHEQGGTYVQMDVSVLAPLEFATPYKFAPHSDRSIAPVIMKVPKGSAFAKDCYDALRAHIHADTIASMEWECSMRLIMEVARRSDMVRDEYMLTDAEYWDLGARTSGPFYDSEWPRRGIKFIHWSNATNGEFKDRPFRGSFYASLLREAQLIADNDPVLHRPTFRAMRKNAKKRIKTMLGLYSRDPWGTSPGSVDG